MGVAVLLMAVGASTALASEWVAKVKFPVTVTGEGGVATFESEEKNKVTCEKSGSEGKVENAAKAKTTVTYSGKCELVVEKSVLGKFKEACPNIVTKELAVEPLSELNKLVGKTGVISKAAAGEVIAEFTCIGVNKVKIKITGSVICQTEIVNIFTKINEITCKKGAAAGKQEFTEGKKGLVFIKGELTAESALGIFKINEKDSQETIEKVTYTNAVGGAEEVKQTP